MYKTNVLRFGAASVDRRTPVGGSLASCCNSFAKRRCKGDPIGDARQEYNPNPISVNYFCVCNFIENGLEISSVVIN
jgi:hypothetical protein